MLTLCHVSHNFYWILLQQSPGLTETAFVKPRQSHDSPQAGHLGADKSASRLRQMGYWVGMLQDVESYCQSCVKYQE